MKCAAIPLALACSSAPASALLLTTRQTDAKGLPGGNAFRSERRFEPRPEAKTAMTGGLLKIHAEVYRMINRVKLDIGGSFCSAS